ncbi:hypothetical protein BB542_09925 [Escherichia coli]|uniref:Uncharacterized protein n=3 Tax=Shigella TaxID=620 RepID=A0A1S9J068_SHIBO|nr:hypothetical protein B6N50_19130 [Escherichia coli C]ATU36327.1 hypothetical protein CSR56_18935 [Escherichia coli]EGD7151085.1 hypothetical protein [Shigella dysenteriae]ESU81394.1 hypothetical protein WRSd3_00767 [Shigella dysenteriae WRSd3]OOO76254.1 hypothetical protein AJR17_022330 [Shigella boydii]
MDRKSGALYTTNTSGTPIIVGAVYSIRRRIFYYRKPSVARLAKFRMILNLPGCDTIDGTYIYIVGITDADGQN